MFFSDFPEIVRPTLRNCSIRAYSARKDLDSAKKDLVWFEKLYDCKMRRKDVEMVILQKHFYNISNHFRLLLKEKTKSKKLQTELLRVKNNFNLRGALGKVSNFPSHYKALLILFFRSFPRRIQGIEKTPGTLQDVEDAQWITLVLKDPEYKNSLDSTR